METLYFNGDIITMEHENETVEAVLVADGIIKALGTYDAVSAQKGNDCTLVDLQGKTLMPAFIDAHGHISQTTDSLARADLSEAKNFDDIVNILKAFAKEKNLTHGEHIVGSGYDHNFLEEKDHPDKKILDQVSTDTPVMIWHASNHMGVVNSKALELSGIDENTPAPDGGTIARYPGTNEPTGYLEETGAMAARCLANPQEFDKVALLMEAQKLYLSNGITTVQDGAASGDHIQLLREVGNAGKFDIDIVAYPVTIMADVKPLMAQNADCVKKYANHIKIGGYKILLDGSPQGKSAWMSEPYENSGDYCGYPWLKPDLVHTLVKQAIDDNQQLLCHCNGDAASQQFLDAYETELAASSNPNKNNLRPVMIHCQTVRDDQLDRMAAIKMIPSIFVAHTYYWGDVHLVNFGQRRGNRVSPVKSALDRGLVYNFHTDTPVVKPKLLHSVWCAVNRITRNGTEIGPEQRIGVYEALKGITINAAYAYFEENSKGSIKAGKQADFVLLDRNPLKVDKMEIKDIQVLETIKDGKSVYKA